MFPGILVKSAWDLKLVNRAPNLLLNSTAYALRLSLAVACLSCMDRDARMHSLLHSKVHRLLHLHLRTQAEGQPRPCSRGMSTRRARVGQVMRSRHGIASRA
ncbi:hypothetical protein ABBQ38_006077 [Trebouxia sp. C0009 RCD-2024]